MILAEIVLIVLYLINNPLAFVFATGFFCFIMFKNRTNLLQGLLRCMIYSSPLFSISIIGNGLHQVFSWVMIFLLLYTIYIFLEIWTHGGKASKILNISVLLVFVILIIRNLFSDTLVLGNFAELFQFLVMIIPIYFTYLSRDNIKVKLKSININAWIKDIQNAVLATAFAVIFQYVAYKYLGVTYGNISLLNNRIIFDLFFKGYSVLSLFLSVGVVLYCDDFFDKYSLGSGLKMLIVIIAIAINSSRSGLMAAMLVCGLIFFKHLNNKKTILLNLLILIVGIVFVYVLIKELTISRGDSSFLVSSGREDTYIYAFNMIKNYITIFLFGGGLSSLNYTQVLPHNFILQLLLTTGIFVTLVLLIFMLGLLKYVKGSKYMYILLAIIIGGLFITDFHSNVFFTVFSICGIISSCFFHNGQKDGD